MPFTPEDIEPDGYVPGTSGLAFTVSRDGEPIGRVHCLAAAGWLNSGKDPREIIARHLNEVEESQGFEKLAGELRAVLNFG